MSNKDFLKGMRMYSSKTDLMGKKFGDNDWRICFRGNKKKEYLEIKNPSRFCSSLKECNKKIKAGIMS